VSTLICLGGWMFVLYMPNQYAVSAKIFVDTRSMLRPLLRGLAVTNTNLESSALLMRRTLLTRPNLEEVARKTDLDLTVKTNQAFDNLVSKLAEKISLAGTDRDNIFSIAYESPDPQLAKRVVDEILNTFLEAALGSTRKDTAVTQKFLDEQIAEYEKRLIEAEERLKAFKQKHVGIMPGEGSNYYGNLKQAAAALAQAELQLREIENRRNELKRQLEGEIPVFGLMEDSPITQSISSPYDSRIAALESQLDVLLLKYTEKHPEIVGIRNTIATLEEKREEELQMLAEAYAEEPDGSPAVAESPLYREMRMALGQADAEVAALKTRVDEYRKRAQEMAKLVDTIPEIEAELKRLDRDYGLNKSQHMALLKRRESARLSHEVDQSSDEVKLKVIDPPRVPLTPIGPDRIRYLSVAFFAALAAGGGLAFLLAQINPRFHTLDELKELTQLPVLGTVMMVSSSRQRTERRMELAMFGLVFSGLVASFIGLITLETLQFDLHGKVLKLTELVT
jgi:polysaccharide chain length determinant protein (PEP-CTERM system associated)